MDPLVLRRAAAEAFATAGAHTPPWPDPHPGRGGLDEEYGRCTDPAKYRILAARADAWTRALTLLGLATPEPVADPAAVWRRTADVAVDEAVLLRPARPDAVPLVLGFGAVDAVPRTALVVGAGEPAVVLERVPDCGCDACDDGSEGLLELLDEAVLAVVTGTFTHIDAGDGREITDTGDGWSASNWDDAKAPAEQELAAARAGRSPYAVVRGAAWG